MSTVANIVNGEIQKNGVAASETKNNPTTKSNDLDKQAFLNLLVTQMKYQDPMEPTDNTEYVSQLATFSSLEQMTNLVASSDLTRASQLVGQYVTIKETNESTMEEKIIGGKVDYVTVENGKGFLNIGDGKYSIDKLDSVVDEKYLNAYNLANEFNASMSALPTLANLTTSYKDIIDNLAQVLSDMNSYEKGFLTPATIADFGKYRDRMEELLHVEGYYNSKPSDDEEDESAGQEV
ncbi:MAG: flagellar hook capping protein [Lachnospiraceae bacterium]|nr:flagellar hook capping protein [Lachnospiraceae bacterium]